MTTQEKAVVNIDADGGVTSCPKGDAADCGFTGGKVCGKCGAMATQEKGKDETPMDEIDEKGATTTRAIPGLDEAPDEGPSSRANPGAKPGENLADLEDPAATVTGDEPDPAEETEDDMKRRRRARARRLAMIGGLKDAQDVDSLYVCGMEKKVMAAGSSPCSGCVGGCAPEGDLPILAEVEGLALAEHDGKDVLDSGYSDTADMFLVDVLRKDGQVVEVIYEGATAECISWKRLDPELIGEKVDPVEPIALIGFDQAAELAVKSAGGRVTEITPGAVEDTEVYVVQVKSDDGEHTVIVSLDGEILDSEVEAKGEPAPEGEGVEPEVKGEVEVTEEVEPEVKGETMVTLSAEDLAADLMELDLLAVEAELDEG